MTYEGVTISHNSRGLRGPEPREANLGRPVVKVLALGGSTTYGIGVSNGDTWPVRLGEQLGNHFEVINGGTPGYTTAENLIQTALTLQDLKPQIIIYFEGWNDARNFFVADNRPDYSNFHLRTLPTAVNLKNHWWQHSALLNRLVLKVRHLRPVTSRKRRKPRPTNLPNTETKTHSKSTRRIFD